MSGYYTVSDNALSEARNLLSQKGSDELQKLMNNDEELTRFVNNLTEVQQLEATKESLKENVRRLALKNLDRDPILNTGKQKLEQLYAKIKRNEEEFRVLKQNYEQYVAETNPDMIWVLLQTTASELENKSDEHANEFFNVQRTEEEVNEFERRFIEERKRAHELKIKADKFRELTQNLPNVSFFQ